MYTCKPFCQVFVYFPAKVLEVLFCPHFPISCANLSLTGVEALKTRKQRSELPLIRQRHKTFILSNFEYNYYWDKLRLSASLKLNGESPFEVWICYLSVTSPLKWRHFPLCRRITFVNWRWRGWGHFPNFSSRYCGTMCCRSNTHRLLQVSQQLVSFFCLLQMFPLSADSLFQLFQLFIRLPTSQVLQP